LGKEENTGIATTRGLLYALKYTDRWLEIRLPIKHTHANLIGFEETLQVIRDSDRTATKAEKHIASF
jgi:hypothetical protein